MRPLPPLNALRAFEATVRLGSLTRAAEELGVTHGAISRHIQTLEGFLGIKLFQPSGRGRVPTPRAATYFADVHASLDRLAGATERMREPAAMRVLRVSTLATFAMRWLIPRLSAFQLAHPQVEVRLMTSANPSEQVDGEFDVVIRRHQMHRPGFACQQFLIERNLPVAAPALLQKHPITAPRDLLTAPLLHCDSKPFAWNEWFSAAGIRRSQVPTAGPRFENYYFTLEAAARGLGFAVGALPLIDDDLKAGRLVAPLAGPIALSDGYHVLYPANRSKGSVMQFVAWLLEQGAQEAAPA
ncbi:MAG: LysR substrate-binding domain-containing protein [Ferrovibrio sp.]|uniref:LysR substrate-binding domain-containing protein n=1 Tax=Ferrovibrio sp. TaxID=1917215 RepID=UPI00261A58F1|nr:LysR substrate-binding domain-containing protein [Ferrovibrio sp.]MCW0233078.1 LysR substrate-binding domain-containing protein [Ferrovibrio sp.]